MASRRNPNVSLNIDLEADAGSARKAIAKDLGKIEDDAKSTVKGIERAFENLSPELAVELDTAEIRQALDLAEQLDGMVASFTVDTDLEEIKQAEQIARSLRSFQGRVDLSVEGREELKDALDLAESMDQIRKVKVEVQGREDLEKAARLAEDLEQRRTVQVDVDDSEIEGAGNKIASELEDGGERGAAGIESAVSDIDFADIGASGADQMSSALAAAGPWGVAAAGISALFAEEFLGGFGDALPAARTDMVRGLRYNLTGSELEEIGATAAEIYGSGLANGLSQSELRDAVAMVKAELGDIDEDFDLTRVTKEALLLSEVLGVDLAEAISTADALVSRKLVENTSEGLNMLLQLAQETGIEFDEMRELIDEFGPSLKAMGIGGTQGFEMMAEIFERRLTPQLDQAGEIFEELNENITNGGAAEAMELIGLNAEEMTKRVVGGGRDGAAAISEIAAAVLAIPDPAQRAAAAIDIFGGNVNLMGTEARDAILEIFTMADGVEQTSNQLSASVAPMEETASGMDRMKKVAADLGNELGTTLADGIETLNSLAQLDFSSAADTAASFGEALALKVLGPASELIGPMDQLANKIGFDLPGAFDRFGGKADEIPPKLASIVDGGGRASGTFEMLGDDASGAADGMDKAKTATEQLDAALQLFSGRFAEDDIMLRLEQNTKAAMTAVEGLTSKAYELGTGFDVSTEKGQNARQAMQDLSGSLDAATGAFERGHISGQTMADTQVRVESSVRAVAAQMGLTQAETDELVAKYASVPSEVSTTFNAYTQAAVGAVAGYAAAIAAIPSTKSTTITTYQQTVFRPTVNPDKRHGGGPVKAGETYIVGGPGAEELFTPDRSGMISDPSETERILEGNPRARAMAGAGGGAGGGGGGVQRVELVVGSDGSAFGDMVVRAMRKEVRNRGGDLDIVFRRN